MIASAVLVALLVIAAAVGLQLLRLIGIEPSSLPERLIYALALGLGAIAYVVLGLGLVGLLSLGPVIAALVALAVVGGPAALRLASSARTPQTNRHEPARGTQGGAPAPLKWAVGVVLGLLAVVVVVNAFVPPGAHEWDALSYHLAVPKIYLERHRIVYLPTQHQSNFPFLMEMLFTLGLLFQGYVLANLLHLATGALCVAALLTFGRRLAPTAGLTAAVVFATTPIVVWEAPTAYIEVAQALYVLLAVLAVTEYQRGREGRWLVLAGVLMGLALSVKTLSLLPFAALVCGLVVARTPPRRIAAFVGLALVVGCPFYVRNWVWTGNPVYPFFYSVFGGRNWNQRLADAYSGSQRGFGFAYRDAAAVAADARGERPAEAPPGPLQRARNVVAAPFGLLAVPRVFYDYIDPGVFNHLGFLFLALPPLLLFAGGASNAGRWCAGVALVAGGLQLAQMQYVRYFVPIVPLLGLVGGEGADRVARRRAWLGWLAGGAVVLQVGLTLGYYVPRLFANTGIRTGPEGARLVEYPGQYEIATSADARESYLARVVNCYAAEQWLNRNAPSGWGVVLYEEARGFYLDRPYLWGNQLHSTYIPYARMRTGRGMADWFLSHGIHYALVNLRFSPYNQPGGADSLWQAMTSGTVPQLFLRWYDPSRSHSEEWRRLIGEAAASGSARFVPEATGKDVVVLEFTAPEGSQ